MSRHCVPLALCDRMVGCDLRARRKGFGIGGQTPPSSIQFSFLRGLSPVEVVLWVGGAAGIRALPVSHMRVGTPFAMFLVSPMVGGES